MTEPSHDIFSLDGRVALVTGAAGWLGAPMATGLAEAGAHVLLAGRTAAPLEAAAKELRGRGLSAEACPFDVMSAESCLGAIQHIRDSHGRLDVLVNNAFTSPDGPTGLDSPESSFSASTESAITAAWRLVINSLDLFRQAVDACGDASVINIGSMYGKVSPDPTVYADCHEPPNPPFYGAAKAGLIQLTRWLACNLGPQRIRVNSVSPGPFPQWDSRERAPQFVARLDAKTALLRVGKRDEVKGAVVFLASRAASFVTGADIPVDGGWTSF